jgi:hypothetical protein
LLGGGALSVEPCVGRKRAKQNVKGNFALCVSTDVLKQEDLWQVIMLMIKCSVTPTSKYYHMKMYGGVELKLRVFITSVMYWVQ